MDYMPPIPKPPIIPSLPQDNTAEEKEKRKLLLADTQEKYFLTKDKAAGNPLGIPLLLKMPTKDEEFDDKYNLGRGVATVPLIVNVEAASKNIPPPDAFKPASSISSYENYYPGYPRPSVIKDWMTDEAFGEQRLSGVNPVMLECVEGFPPGLDVDQVKAALEGEEQLAELIEKRSLYAVDYSEILADVTGGEVNVYGMPTPIKKYLPKPIALFKWDDDPLGKNDPSQKNGRLLPIAIQIDIDDSGGSKVFTPQSPPLLWGIAKLCFSAADSNVHEMHTHLGCAHFAQEAFGAVTPRQLAPEHPVHILLKPHLRFMVFNNAAGLSQLIQKDGPVDFLLAGTLEQSTNIAIKSSQTWSVTDTFPLTLQKRGVTDEKSLPHYPYRDDGLLIWGAIHQYVSQYLGLYYKDPSDLSGDYELKNWAEELASTEMTGGNILDMPKAFATPGELADILTQIIFTASAGHSSVNFTQYPYLGFSPNSTLAGYADYQAFLSRDDTTDKAQLEFYLAFLPPPVMAIGQIKITGALSAYHYDQLGDYQDEFDDGLARHTLYRFTQNLHDIEEKINARNRSRIVDYPYMKPSEILNSASI